MSITIYKKLMVFRNYALYPQMTVARNMGFALELAGVKRPEIDKKVSEAAAILGLQPLLERKPAQLSGGQRQCVAMGRAIVRDPEVFLFDEPLSSLDAKLRVNMRAEIKALHQRLKTTIVYVAHDQIEAMTRLLFYKEGASGRSAAHSSYMIGHETYSSLASLGSPAMNILEGTLQDGTSPALTLSGGSRAVLSRAPSASAGRPVTYTAHCRAERDRGRRAPSRIR